MIPLQIQIKNFLSYGADLQTIDFTPYHLVCLSGKNGHGKSALLDAITWAIWGHARKVSGAVKADQGLVKLGQTHMLVILDFVCQDTHYRVRREFAFTHGKPYAALDFGIVDENNEAINSLTEKTIRGTQKKIEQTIHLDYDSFINSAFLRQGQANEFSKKSPKERKEILANILGLQRYEALRKQANDTAREALSKQAHLKAMQEKIASQLAQADTIKTEYKQIMQQLNAHEKQTQELQKTELAVQKKRDLLAQQEMQAAQLIKQQTALHKDQREKQTHLRTILHAWRNTQRLCNQLQDPKAIKREKETYAKQINAFQQALQQKLEIKEHILRMQQKLQACKQKLEHTQQTELHKQLLALQQKELIAQQQEQQLKALQEQLNKKEFELKQLATSLAKTQTTSVTIDEKALTTIETQFEKRRAHYQQWIAQANWTKQELQAIDQKRTLTQDADSPSCPLCEQNLSASRKKFLKSKLSVSSHFLTHRFNRLSTLITKLKQILVHQHAHIVQLKKQREQAKLQEIQNAQGHKQCLQLQQDIQKGKQEQTTINKQLATRIDNIKKETVALESTKASMAKQCMQNPELLAIQKQLDTLDKSYKTITYDAQKHKQTQELLHKLEKQLSHVETMQQDVAKQASRKAQIQQLCSELKKIKIELKNITQAQKPFATLATQTQKLAHEQNTFIQKQAVLTNEKEKLLQAKGRLEQQQTTLDNLATEHKKGQKQIKKLQTEIDDYQIIAGALGKNGIQALLIEDTIPEIEQEANNLLSRLTDNQAQIFIESLRDLKSGGTKETLDIKISDAAGIRPYEMFSGGEAFRIDFSLRIAISKLLARRAGTSLQTLIIDEGFGSQDEEGIAHIMDAIHRIQDDFKKVIIVSHLARLKDQFPVHFHVQKRPGGSHVDVIELA